MTAIVHAFVCSRIDYCNYLLIGHPKVLLFPIKSVINAAAKLIDRLPKCSHISSFVINQLHSIFSSHSKWMLPRNTSGIIFAHLYLQLRTDNPVLSTGSLSLFRELGPLWHNLDPFPPLGHPFEMSSLPLFDWICALWNSSCILLPPKSVFYSPNLCTESSGVQRGCGWCDGPGHPP